jgi:uncharacterized membrane protein
MENSSGKSALGLDANVAAGLAYLPVCGINLIMSIIILVTDKTNKLARFHAFQSLLLLAAALIIEIPAYFLMVILFLMNSTITSLLGGLFGLVLTVVGLAIFVFMVIALIKAFQGQVYKIPFIGDMADKWSN